MISNEWKTPFTGIRALLFKITQQSGQYRLCWSRTLEWFVSNLLSMSLLTLETGQSLLHFRAHLLHSATRRNAFFSKRNLDSQFSAKINFYMFWPIEVSNHSWHTICSVGSIQTCTSINPEDQTCPRYFNYPLLWFQSVSTLHDSHTGAQLDLLYQCVYQNFYRVSRMVCAILRNLYRKSLFENYSPRYLTSSKEYGPASSQVQGQTSTGAKHLPQLKSGPCQSLPSVQWKVTS